MIRQARMFTVALGLALLAPALVQAQTQESPLPARRQRMERQLREGMFRVARDRVGLTDEQMSKLQVTASRYDDRRRMLLKDERAQRQLLRSELLAGNAANQDRVAGAMDRLLQLHRQRLDLMADEQKELSAFMTPVQRARYAALQDQLRRRADVLRRARAGGPVRP